MNKYREKILYASLGLTISALLVVFILRLYGKISLYFSTGIISVFSSISEISLYILVIVLALNTLLHLFVKKHNKELDNITVSLVYFLLTTTIISVNVVIWAWILAVGLSISLFILSVFDIFPQKK